MYQERDNKFWKMGHLRKRDGTEGMPCMTARIEVGPGGSQVTMDELRRAAAGQPITKYHLMDAGIGKVKTQRVDAQIDIGPDPERQWTTAELTEIVGKMEARGREQIEREKRRIYEEEYRRIQEADLREQIEKEIRAEVKADAKTKNDLVAEALDAGLGPKSTLMRMNKAELEEEIARASAGGNEPAAVGAVAVSDSSD